MLIVLISLVNFYDRRMIELFKDYHLLDQTFAIFHLYLLITLTALS